MDKCDSDTMADDAGEGPSMEGAVFEVGDSEAGHFYQVMNTSLTDSETFFKADEQDYEKSLNQNVFGKKVLVLPKPTEYDEETFNVSSDVFEEGTMQVVEDFETESSDVKFEESSTVTSAELEGSVMQFEDGSVNGTVVFEHGSEMEMGGSTIFFLPSMVGEEQLGVAMGAP